MCMALTCEMPRRCGGGRRHSGKGHRQGMTRVMRHWRVQPGKALISLAAVHVRDRGRETGSCGMQ